MTNFFAYSERQCAKLQAKVSGTQKYSAFAFEPTQGAFRWTLPGGVPLGLIIPTDNLLHPPLIRTADESADSCTDIFGAHVYKQNVRVRFFPLLAGDMQKSLICTTVIAYSRSINKMSFRNL